MVGLLNAPKNTSLYNKLKTENRLTTEATGDNTDYTMNFIPKMNKTMLIEGYKNIIQNIYSIKPYYKRIRQLLSNYNNLGHPQRINLNQLKAFIRSTIVIGIINKGRFEYWKLLIWTLINRPKLIPNAITLAVFGYHYRIVYGISNKN
ncbi:MAG: DUF4070 domain-containing protein [Salinivirgaceae bacterium]|jgi:hypothetical protein|nr:DUF4070 domain-containing protein [Salinivirgaceae bacterium]